MERLKPFPFDLVEVRKEMSKKWRLKGNIGLANLGEGKVLLEFALNGEALRVLWEGERSLSNFRVNLCR